MASKEAEQTFEEPATRTETRFTDSPFRETTDPITLRAIMTSILGGAVGIIAMLPVAVGIPAVFGLFKLEAPAGFAFLIGAQPSATLGMLFFVIGGVVVLPLFFAVTATFLPPAEPPYARGLTMATIFWPGFVIGFWPAAGFVTNAVFLGVSLASHWVYGLTLGIVLHKLMVVPEHDL